MANKNAEDMFRKIGFIREDGDDSGTIEYCSPIMGDIKIEFILIDETYNVSADDPYNDNRTLQAVTITMHEAITQQLKEMGWIND